MVEGIGYAETGVVAADDVTAGVGTVDLPMKAATRLSCKMSQVADML